jgi:hypothetical protein
MSGMQTDTTLHQPALVFSKVHSGNWEVPRGDISLISKVMHLLLYPLIFISEGKHPRSLPSFAFIP